MKNMLTALLVAVALGGGVAHAQAPAAGGSAGNVPPSAAGAAVGVQGQNIFDVRPEASADPGYLQQSNGERARVQPGNNAPMWRQVGQGVAGYSSLPASEAPEAGVLIQRTVRYPGSHLTNAGEAWRQVRNHWLVPYGAALLVLVVLATALHFFTLGTIKLNAPPTGRKIERFTPFERAVHWANAGAFTVLAVSGIVMAFGRFFLLPVLGSTVFGELSYVLKNLHNFVGPLFVVTTAFTLVTFARDNIPRREDLGWLLRGGGLITGKEVPSHRFNGGEKLLFWGGVLGLSVAVIASGLFLDQLLPGIVYTRGGMQIAHMVHATATVLLMVLIVGHIYLGTLGMEGAYKAMREGYVDETWARQHHELWWEDIAAGKIPAQRSKPAPPSAGAPPAKGSTA